MERFKSTVVRCVVHVLHLVSDLFGDDWLSKRVRMALLRLFRARLGRGTEIHGRTYFTAPWRLRTGRDCFINRNCYLDLEGPITLGDDVVIGHGATIITTEHAIDGPHRRAGPSTSRAVTVGDGAWLCANVTVLPDVNIGRGAVVAAGAVVTADVGDNLLVAGVPARVVRTLASDGPAYDGIVIEPGAIAAPRASETRTGRAAIR